MMCSKFDALPLRGCALSRPAFSLSFIVLCIVLYAHPAFALIIESSESHIDSYYYTGQEYVSTYTDSKSSLEDPTSKTYARSWAGLIGFGVFGAKSAVGAENTTGNLGHYAEASTESYYSEQWISRGSQADVPVTLNIRHEGDFSLITGGYLGVTYEVSGMNYVYRFMFDMTYDGMNRMEASFVYDDGINSVNKSIPVTVSGNTFSYDFYFAGYISPSFTESIWVNSSIYGEDSAARYINSYNSLYASITSEQGYYVSDSNRQIGQSPSAATPEPGTLILMGVGAAGAAFMKRRRATSHGR